MLSAIVDLSALGVAAGQWQAGTCVGGGWMQACEEACVKCGGNLLFATDDPVTCCDQILCESEKGLFSRDGVIFKICK